MCFGTIQYYNLIIYLSNKFGTALLHKTPLGTVNEKSQDAVDEEGSPTAEAKTAEDLLTFVTTIAV